MKNLFSLTTLFCWSLLGYGQEVTIESSPSSFRNRIDSLLMNLDLSEIENGILYERGFPWAKFDDYSYGVK